MTAATATTASPSEQVAPNAVIAAAPKRLASLDAYRGLVMFLMVAEVLHFDRIARAFPESGFWGLLASQQDHREWIGCSLHDLIQPSFTFLVGVALPFSIASRVAKGQAFGTMVTHAIWRSFVLIFLGIFLRSVGATMTNFTFEDTLTQIGLGYTFAFLLAFARTRTQWIALGLILFIIMAFAARRFGFRRPGLLGGIFVLGYALARIAAEFFREPDAQLGFLFGSSVGALGGGITMGMLLSIPMALVGAGAIVLAARGYTRSRQQAVKAA